MPVGPMLSNYLSATRRVCFSLRWKPSENAATGCCRASTRTDGPSHRSVPVLSVNAQKKRNSLPQTLRLNFPIQPVGANLNRTRFFSQFSNFGFIRYSTVVFFYFTVYVSWLLIGSQSGLIWPVWLLLYLTIIALIII